MKFTNFKDFGDALEKMGVFWDDGEITLVEFYIEKNVKLDDKVILGENGIYYLDKQRGVVTRLTLNISDSGIESFLRKQTGKKLGEEGIKKIALEKDFNNGNFVEALHRYHFTECQTIKRVNNEKRKDRFLGSSRWTGDFKYSLIKHNKVFFENNNQKLYPCKHCLKKLMKLNGDKYRHDNFNIKDALKIKDQVGNNYNLECSYTPNIYSHDFPKIAKRLKKAKNYTCEECGTIKKNGLHCHHINHQKSDNREINLQVLCKNCHVEIHSHMKNL